jgi:hypothetical protein
VATRRARDRETDEPSAALTALGAEAARLGCSLNVGMNEIDPLAWAIRGLMAR